MPLTRAELTAYRTELGKLIRWLESAETRLRARTEYGEVLQLTTKAKDALLHLAIVVHYEGCDGAGEVNNRPKGDGTG